MSEVFAVPFFEQALFLLIMHYMVIFLVLYAPHKRINVEMNFPRQFLPFGGERSNQETVAVVVVGV